MRLWPINRSRQRQVSRDLQGRLPRHALKSDALPHAEHAMTGPGWRWSVSSAACECVTMRPLPKRCALKTHWVWWSLSRNGPTAPKATRHVDFLLDGVMQLKGDLAPHGSLAQSALTFPHTA